MTYKNYIKLHFYVQQISNFFGTYERMHKQFEEEIDRIVCDITLYGQRYTIYVRERINGNVLHI